MHGNFPNPEQLLDYLKYHIDDNWLNNFNSREFYELTKKFYLQFTQSEKISTIFLAEENPNKFLAVFLAAVASNKCHIFLCNPHWQQQEWQQVFDLVKPDLIIGKVPDNLIQKADTPSSSFFLLPSSFIMLPTGGSSGNIRFAIHTWETLLASVRGFTEYFNVKKVNFFCVLPLYHVSGLMQFLRSFLTKGHLVISSYKTLKEAELNSNYQDYFLSLVPTQLQVLLQSHSTWLSQFKTVLIGGAPAWRSLLEEARKAQIKLALTYGMTETASQLVTLQPDDFLKNNQSSGRILPHAKVTIINDIGEVLESNQTGIIKIESESLCLGYYPNLFRDRIFQTDDLGYFDEQGYLYIVGRNSQKIITGGENVFPAEIEAAILETQLVKDVAVIGLPDEQWGQVITAIYVPKENITTEAIAIAIESKISKYKIPKIWIAVENLPRNSQGKLNYQQLQKIAFDSQKINLQ